MYLSNAHRKTKTNECLLPSLARQSPHKAFYWFIVVFLSHLISCLAVLIVDYTYNHNLRGPQPVVVMLNK